MIEKAISIVFALVLAAAGVWWFNDSIRDYYQAPLIESYAEAQRLAKKQTETRAASNDKLKLEAENAKIKQLESNLAAAKRTSDSAVRLRDAIRASEERSKTDLTACVQHSRTLREVLDSGAELAGRIAKEADGHVADKQELTAAWPK